MTANLPMTEQQLNEALTLEVGESPLWSVRNRFDKAAIVLADRHYSRRPGKRGSNQVGGVGKVLTLVSPCERNLWVSRYMLKPMDGLDAFRCSYFHREAGALASDQIIEAMRLTLDAWGELPADRWVTWVDTRKVQSRNPGYCFLKAGWWRDRTYEHPYLLRFRAE